MLISVENNPPKVPQSKHPASIETNAERLEAAALVFSVHVRSENTLNRKRPLLASNGWWDGWAGSEPSRT
jgi:hypothetical protein